MFSLRALCSAEWVSAIGSIVGGVAALAAIAFAWWLSRKELPKWRAQYRAQKRAEVAGQALSSCLEAAEALRHVADGTVDHGWKGTITTHPDKESWTREQYALRWAEVAHVFRALHVAHGMARTQFGESECKALADLQKLQREVAASQGVWLKDRRSHTEIANRTVAVGNHVLDQVTELEQLAERTFGPAARMDDAAALPGGRRRV